MIDVSLPQVLSYVGLGLGGYWLYRRKLHQVRLLVDDIDDALQDDKLSEEEFRKVFADLRAFFPTKR